MDDWAKDVVSKALEKDPLLLDKFFAPFYTTENSGGQCRACKQYAPNLEQFKMVYWHDQRCAVRGALMAMGIGVVEPESGKVYKRLFLKD